MTPEPLTRSAGNGDQRLVRAEVVGDGADVRDRAVNLDAADVRVPLGPLVVDESDHLHPDLRAVLDLAGQRLAGVSAPMMRIRFIDSGPRRA
jgi:hypothetical protein